MNDTATPPEEKTIQPKPTPQKLKTFEILMGLFVITVTLCMIAFYYLIHSEQATVLTAIRNTEQSISQQQQLIVMNKRAIHSLSQHFDTDRSIGLIKAKHLTRMAVLSLYTYQDIPTTITLLNKAKMRLGNADRPDFNRIRQMLATDIGRLKQVPRLDQLSLYLKIQDIDNQIASLPLAIEDLKKQPAAIDQDQEKSPQTNSKWKKGLKESWQNIRKSIVIHHDEQEVILPLTTAQHTLLVLNLHLLLSQTQSALLQGRTVIYQTNLQKTKEMIKQHFSKNDQTVKQILLDLSAYQKVTIAPKIPDIRKTLSAIQKAIHQGRDKTPPQKDKTA